MMIRKGDCNTSKLEGFVEHDSIFRFLSKYTDFNFIYDKLVPYYSTGEIADIDVIIPAKIMFFQTLVCIESLEETWDVFEFNIEFIWFLGLTSSEEYPSINQLSEVYDLFIVPDEVVEEIYEEIFKQLRAEEAIKDVINYRITFL